MRPTIRLALRDWDYLTPILLGDVKSPDFDVVIDRVFGNLIDNHATSTVHQGGEMSFSRYVQARDRGVDDVVAVPHFLMRAFRHRCMITAKSSPLQTVAELAGKTIGMTGWQDSGNTWTRAILRREGIGVDDAQWRLGRLAPADPDFDRLGPWGVPGRIEQTPHALYDLLHAGELDAVFTPFMPPGFYDADSKLRFLLPDFRAAEVAYFHAIGFVPGIHLLALQRGIVAAHPGLPQALSELFDESTGIWLGKREKYADTTPWMIDELARCGQDLPVGWDRNGFAVNEPMIDAFAEEQSAQRLTKRRWSPRELFPGRHA